MLVTPVQTRVMMENEDLFSFIIEHVAHVQEKTICVISSKIIALSQGRTTGLIDVKSRDALIRKYADAVLTNTYPPLTYQDGMYTAAAGVDASNGNGKLILPPRNAWKTAHDLKVKIMKKYRVEHIGVLIVDSMPLPGKQGVISHAVACAGFVPVQKYAGTKDIFGRIFEYSSANYADAFAAASGVVMGEGAEQCPLAFISDSPAQFTTKKMQKRDLVMQLQHDIFQPLAQRVESIVKKTKK